MQKFVVTFGEVIWFTNFVEKVLDNFLPNWGYNLFDNLFRKFSEKCVAKSGLKN